MDSKNPQPEREEPGINENDITSEKIPFYYKVADIAKRYWQALKGGVSRMTRTDKWALAICLLLAVTVWLYVMSTIDTSYENPLTFVNVSIKGDESLRNNNLSIISGSNNMVTVTLKGRRADIGGLNAKDIKAYVDVSQINGPGEYDLDVKVDVPSNSTLVSIEPAKLLVEVDVNSSKELEIQVKLNYNTDSSYEVSFIPDVTRVTVKGPKSILDTIEYAAVKGEIGAITKSQKMSGKVALYDKSHRMIDSPYLEVSVAEVMINIPVLAYKNVPVKVAFVGDSLKYDVTKNGPEQLTLKGEPSLLAEINEIVIYTVSDSNFTPGEEKIISIFVDSLDLPEGVVVQDENTAFTLIIERRY